MKHEHYDKIVAKAANMDLVVFCRDAYHVKEGWFETSNLPIQEEFDYFLCLPQHKEACLVWLCGGELQQHVGNQWLGFESRKECPDWFKDKDFMDRKCKLRVKPRKEKRWVVIDDKQYLFPTLYTKDPSDELTHHYQVFQIEIDV